MRVIKILNFHARILNETQKTHLEEYFNGQYF